MFLNGYASLRGDSALGADETILKDNATYCSVSVSFRRINKKPAREPVSETISQYYYNLLNHNSANSIGTGLPIW